MNNYCEAGATVHGIRHAFRDRLRAVEAPVDLIDQLGGWSVKSVGMSFGDGYDMCTAQHHISHICADMAPRIEIVLRYNKCMRQKLFYISTSGSSASTWLARTLSMHEEIIVSHGSEIPAFKNSNEFLEYYAPLLKRSRFCSVRFT